MKLANPFSEKCICLWSKDDEYGFIDNTECPVHGKAAKESLKECVPIKSFDLSVGDELFGELGRDKCVSSKPKL